MTDEEISSYIETGDLPRLTSISLGATSLNNIPWHSQSMERNIKLVSEASRNAIGVFNRDGFIKCTMKLRGNMPVFETESDFDKN